MSAGKEAPLGSCVVRQLTDGNRATYHKDDTRGEGHSPLASQPPSRPQALIRIPHITEGREHAARAKAITAKDN